MMLLITILSVCGVAGLAAGVGLANDAKALAAWQQFGVARREGGEIVLEVGRRDARVRLETGDTRPPVPPPHRADEPPAFELARSRTWVRAPFVLGAGPAFEVHPTSLADLVRERRGDAGLIRLRVGDADFDRRFHVFGHLTARLGDNPRTPEIEAHDVAVAWSPRARALRDRLPGAVVVRSTGRLVELVYDGALTAHHDIDAAIELVAELAHAGAERVAALFDLAGVVPFAASGEVWARLPPHVVWSERGVAVWPVVQGGRVPRTVTAVVATRARTGTPFVLTLDERGQPAGAPPEGLPWGAAAASLGGVGAARLEATATTLSLVFPSFETGEARLLAAARVVQALASGLPGAPGR